MPPSRNVNITQLKNQLAKAVVDMDHIKIAMQQPMDKPQQDTLAKQLHALSIQLDEIQQLQVPGARFKLKKLEKNKRWRKKKQARDKQTKVMAKQQEQQQTQEQELASSALQAATASPKQPLSASPTSVSKAPAEASTTKEPQKNKKHEDAQREARLRLEKMMLLRELRRRRLEQQGGFVADDDTFFEQVKRAFEEADKEEKEEKVAEKNAETGKMDTSSTLVTDAPHPDDQWHGMSLDRDAYAYWRQGNTSLRELRRVRMMWDQFIVADEKDLPSADQARWLKVPPTWVAPPPPATAAWAKFVSRPP
ncbi:hypothetical protein BC940DRAFT_335971 [Gongronella butleri]|nr:hypothetical protein BC940DRAFT_335971 [Gongronella butleri]